jgi:short-subunit dehydrogenase
MPEGQGKTALVTGASSGIGKAFAELLAAKGYALVLTARRGDRLEALAAELRQKHQVATHTIVADLAQPDASQHIVSALASERLAIDFLVNNAGYGQPGSYVNVTWQDHERFMQVMVIAVLDLSYRLLPGMIERKWGRIVNIASVAGMVPSPAGHTLYGASKSFLIRFSEALSSEMNKMPGIFWLKADDVVREGYDAVMKGHSVVVNGVLYRFLVWLNGAMPRGLSRQVSTMIGRRYRKA